MGAEVLGIGEGVGGRWRWKIGLNELLVRAAWGREVEGVVTGLLVWCVWWPAWVIGAMVVVGRPKRSA